MMYRKSPLFFTLGILLLLSALLFGACNFSPRTETPEPGSIETSAAQTIEVNMKQLTIDALQAQLTAQSLTLQAPAPTLPPTSTALPTDTSVPPTAAAPPVLPSPTLPPPTPAPPMLTANVETRCRQGPSTNFPVVSYILVGQQAQVIGRNPAHTWWLIRDPQGTFGNCWVWGETTQLIGSESQVPEVQPPPEPTQPSQVSFQTTYSNIHICGGVATVVFLVGNNGSVAFQSSSITIRDVTNGVGLSGPESSNSPFMPNQNSCPPGFDSLPPGSNGYVAKGMGILPPSGIKGRGIIVLCTKENLGGQCLEQHANFTFP
jgi:hypothetical protein